MFFLWNNLLSFFPYYYLRVCTIDIIGNLAPWKTLYIFQYEEATESTNNNSGDTKLSLNDILIYGIVIMSGILCCKLIYFYKKRLRR